jgi:uncharacterized membrane protein YeaQ/YmgE (transglycosylase-associated protein family)
MNIESRALIIFLIIGLIAGFIASLLVGGGGGILRYLLTGFIGAFVGGALVQAGLLNLPFLLEYPWAHQILISTIGAILIILLARLIAR